MTIYSLYIYDRHCDCVYYQAWHRTTSTRPGKDVLPGVAPGVALSESTVAQETNATFMPSSRLQGDIPLDGRASPAPTGATPTARAIPPAPPKRRGLPFDEEAKLVYGVLFSVRSMGKKLAGKENEQFIAFKTSAYKMHLFETTSGYKFVLFSDPAVESLKFVLKSIYQTAFIEFVVRNPMITMDSRISGKGIDNQAFRTAVNNFVSSLSVFR